MYKRLIINLSKLIIKIIILLIISAFVVLHITAFAIKSYPENLVSTMQRHMGIEVSYEQKNLNQGLISFDVEFNNLSLKHQNWQFKADRLKFDLDLSNLFKVYATLGNELLIENTSINIESINKIRLNKTPLNKESSNKTEKIIKMVLKKYWRHLTLKSVRFSYKEKNNTFYLLVKKLNSDIESNEWLLEGDIEINYASNEKTIKHVETLSTLKVNAKIKVDSWGIPMDGVVNWTTHDDSFNLNVLRSILSVKQADLIPFGSLLLKGEAHILNGDWYKLSNHFSLKKENYNNKLLVNDIEFDVIWQSTESDSFLLKNLKIDNKLVGELPLIKVVLIDKKLLKIDISSFDAKPFVPIINQALITYASVSKETLEQRNVELEIGHANVELEFPSLIIKQLEVLINNLETPEIHAYPGFKFNTFKLKKKDKTIAIEFLEKVTVFYSEVFDRPLSLKFNEPIKLSYKKNIKNFELEPFRFDVQNINIKLAVKADLPNIQANMFAEAKCLQQIKDVLPYKLMDIDLENWLKDSLVEGKDVSLQANLGGDLREFPFKNSKKGTFTVDAIINNTELKFQPDWPALKDFKAHLNFKPYDLIITSDKAIISGLQTSDIHVAIKNLDSPNVALEFSGKGHGKAKTSQNFLLKSPIAKHADMETFLQEDAVLRGNVSAHLKRIWIPLKGYEGRKKEVKVDVNFNKTDLTLFDTFPLKSIEAQLNVDGNKINVDSIKGYLMGSPFTGNIYTNKNQSSLFVKAKGILNVPKKQSLLRGHINWQHRVEISISKDNPILMQTDLDFKDLDSLLPVPFDSKNLKHKKARFNYKESSGNNFKLTIPSLIKVNGNIFKGSIPFKNISIVMGSDKTTKYDSYSNGVQINGSVDNVYIDDWIKKLPEIMKLFPQDIDDKNTEIVLHPSTLNIKQLHYLNYDYGLSNINMYALSKNKIVMEMHNKSSDVKVIKSSNDWSINIAKLMINTDEIETDKQDKCKILPKTNVIPNLKVTAKNLQWGKRKIDKLDFKSTSLPDRLAIKNMKFVIGNAKGTGSYLWNLSKNNSHFKVNIKTNKVSDLVKAINLDEGITGKKGKSLLDFTWLGGPNCFSIDRVKGKIYVRLDDGVLKNVEPGIGRLIGLLSLESIAKRLKLDIGDVKDAGLFYSVIESHATISNGMLNLKNFKLASPSNSSKLFGKVNLVDKEFNLKAEVTPAIGSTIATISAIVGVANPVVAVLSYVLLKNVPIVNENLITYRFKVTGPWDNPIIEEQSTKFDFIKLDN